MSPAVASLLALLAAIVISFASKLNVGVVAIPLAWAVGAYGGRGPEAVLAGFPGSLFVTLGGVTLLFALAESNGTIANLAARLASLARGRSRLLPPIMFFAAFAISTAGPGAIPSVALMAPLAFAMAPMAAIPPFLTALMVANGANAGNLSPLSAVGIIANTRMAEAGLGGHEWKVGAANCLVHVLVSGLAYAALVRTIPATSIRPDPRETALAPLNRSQWGTVVVIMGWVAAVVALGAPLGLAAFAGAAVIIAVRLADERAAIKAMPWPAILMVCGVSMLVTMAERTGGMQLFTRLLATLATPDTLNGVIAFVTGAISTASSTSGVVLPTMLPTVPALVQQVGGGDPLAVALSINVGAALVDVSPLSTIGAICVAALANADLARRLFRSMLVWGLSMTLVAALLCQLFAGWFARL
ncbi:MAG: C4-dicarboxylate ABC transporter [Acidobacteria bacterium]|nr:C4-dicarboxylate ABC transporter [Acidobacteriota bacterium]